MIPSAGEILFIKIVPPQQKLQLVHFLPSFVNPPTPPIEYPVRVLSLYVASYQFPAEPG